MDIGVRSEALSLRNLFRSGHFFRLPAFQRSYAWDDDEAIALFNDLRDAMVLGIPHFIGTVVLVEDPDRPGVLEIVDGQQRLTTLTIILAAIRDLLGADAGVRADLITALCDDSRRQGTRWRLTLNEFDAPFFQATVQESGATLVGDEQHDGVQSRERLAGNTGKIVKALRELPKRELAEFAGFVLDGVSLVTVYVADRENAHRVFMIINDRGKGPNNHDILKTEILEKSGFSEDEVNAYARQWSSYEARIRGRGMDDLLQNIRIIMDNGKTGGPLLATFRRVVLNRLGPTVFMDKVLPAYVDAEEALQNCQLPGNDKPGPQIENAMRHLSGIEHAMWRSATLKFIVERGHDLEAARRFFPLMERLAWAHQLVFTEKKQREKRYKRVIEAIDDDRVLFDGEGPLAISREDSKKIAERLLGRFTSIGQRRALVMRLNAAMPGGEIVAARSNVSVEHVLPKSPENGDYWLTVWPNSAVRAQLTDSVGNFVLLPKEVNTKADRMHYHDKLKVYFRGGAGDAYAITRDLHEIHTWTPDVVKRRTVRLANTVLRAWGLETIPED
jgi:hypothetical protein